MRSRKLTEEEKLIKEKDKYKHKCSCGHSVFVIPPLEKNTCSWCKKYVFANKKLEMMWRIREITLREKRRIKCQEILELRSEEKLLNHF